MDRAATIVGELRCTGCGETKPTAGFHRNCTASRGYTWRCKLCVNSYQQALRARRKAGDYGPTVVGGKRSGRYVGPDAAECAGCRVVKPYSAFSRDTAAWGGHSPRCRECRSADLFNRRARLRTYGLTPDTFAVLLRRQGGGCAICGGPQRGKGTYHVDHCHTTGRVRGLLCHHCNTALGLVGDSVERLHQLIAYLNSHR